jgi:hypothetical protein
MSTSFELTGDGKCHHSASSAIPKVKTFKNLIHHTHTLRTLSKLTAVGQFGVSEIDCLTEPSAVAPDAGGKLRTKQVAHHPRSFGDASVNWMNFSAGALSIIFHLS